MPNQWNSSGLVGLRTPDIMQKGGLTYKPGGDYTNEERQKFYQAGGLKGILGR